MDLYTIGYYLVIPAMLFAFWAQYKVNSSFRRFSEVRIGSGMSGAQAARMILDSNGLQDVSIEQIGGSLTDNYDPRSGVVHLSEDVFGSNSVAAVGVAAHECGHAVQHAAGYAPLRLRNAIIPVTQIGSNLAFPLFLLGILLSYSPLMEAGIFLFSIVTFFQIVTLPVETDASSRALRVLVSCGIVSEEERQEAKDVLNAAALTYVAALAVSLANLLRLISIAGSGRRRR